MRIINYFFYTLVSNFPDSYLPIIGEIANKIRVYFFKKVYRENKKSEKIIIQKKVELSFNELITIGNFSSIGKNSMIQGPITIGESVMIGPSLMTFTSNHIHSEVDIPMNLQGTTPKKGIVIEDDVWIGARVTIMPGVKIGTGAIIGAGTVVSKNVKNFDVVVGGKQTVIKNRKE